MVIDSNAATSLTRYTGDPSQTDYLRYDISNLAHHALDDADVLVVGVGGGRTSSRRSSSIRGPSPVSRSTGTSSRSRTGCTATSPAISTATHA